MTVSIRSATSSEIMWINQQYDLIGFQHAENNDIIAIAELENQKLVGMGRLVHLDNTSLELAGIYVFETYRNKGIAKKIIQFLISFSQPNTHIYCLPFSKIEKLYRQFGFVDCVIDENLPKYILDKCAWCAKSHKAAVNVLIFNQQLS